MSQKIINRLIAVLAVFSILSCESSADFYEFKFGDSKSLSIQIPSDFFLIKTDTHNYSFYTPEEIIYYFENKSNNSITIKEFLNSEAQNISSLESYVSMLNDKYIDIKWIRFEEKKVNTSKTYFLNYNLENEKIIKLDVIWKLENTNVIFLIYECRGSECEKEITKITEVFKSITPANK